MIRGELALDAKVQINHTLSTTPTPKYIPHPLHF